jgi:hypothetical protein
MTVQNNVYDEDDLVRCLGEFANALGVATDPSTVTFYWSDTSGVQATYVYGVHGELVKDSTGNYHVDMLPTQPGLYIYRFRGTGSVTQGGEEEVFIRPSRVA